MLELAKREGHKLSSDELEAISGGSTWECADHDWYCTDDNFFGDSRKGIDRSRVSATYAEGSIDARDLDW